MKTARVHHAARRRGCGWPLAARAQQPAMPLIGYLSSEASELGGGRLHAFRQGLSETGYVEGRNVAIEYRWAEGQYDRLPSLAADLVRRQVAVIAQAGHVLGAFAAKAATKTIPVVFVTGVDPVTLGFVASLNRPGGNLTGATTLGLELEPKRLELLHGVVPTTKTIGALVNPIHPNAEAQSRGLQAAAAALGRKLQIFNASTERDFDTIFTRLVEVQAGGLLITTDALFISHAEQLAALAVRYAVPAIFQFRGFAAAGGLMSYGGALADLYRHSGVYTGRILKGEKPGDLPVHQVTRVELIINLKSAKALNFTIPPSLLGRADEVIQYETSPPQAISASGSGRCRVARVLAQRGGAELSGAAGAHHCHHCRGWVERHSRPLGRSIAIGTAWPAFCR